MRPSTPVQSSGFVKTPVVLNDAPHAVGDQPVAPAAGYQEVIFFQTVHRPCPSYAACCRLI